MKRRGFLAASAAVACAPLLGAAAAPAPTLRVLLGKGDPQPVAGGGFTLGGRTYRGEFSRSADGSVVNVVALDDYLYSVVPREMSPAWPAAALQTQAVCARTFVLGRLDPQRAYDVVASAVDQVYDGVGAESPAGRAAVDATAGTIVRYGSALADVAYSSCCGGRTEAASDAWGGAPLPYLGGVACPYCTASPEYRWSSDIGFDAIADAFAERLEPFGALHDVRMGPRDASGRVRSVSLVTASGSFDVRASDFRFAVGPQLVRSLLVFASRVDGPVEPATAAVLHVDGGGSGHGVGLCQWGARGLAIAGGNVAQTTSFYFPGTTLDAWTNVSSPPTTTRFRRS